MSSKTPAPKRAPGRPKGTTNKPSAGAVGRPRKDGKPPRRKSVSVGHQGTPGPADITASDGLNGPSVTHESPPTITGSGEAIDGDGQGSVLPPRPDQDHVQGTVRVHSQSTSSGNGDCADPPVGTLHSMILTSYGESHETAADEESGSRPIHYSFPEVIGAAADEDHGLDNPYGSDLQNAPIADEDDEDDDPEVEKELDEEFQPPGDDEEPNKTHRSSASRSTMPTWLENEYDILRERLSDEIGRGRIQQLPSCYKAGTFWHGSDPFFSARTMHQVDPGVFHHPLWFVWIPHLLLGCAIPCPACKIAGRSSANSGAVPLQRAGWTSQPRRVVDVDRVVYLIGTRYRCGLCGKGYQGWSPAILATLPSSLRAQFPFHLTHRGGLTDQLVAILRESFREGIGPLPFTKMIQSLHYRRYDLLRVQFYELVRERMEGGMVHFLTPMTHFGAFGDRDGYAGFVPSHSYFSRFHDTLIEAWAPELEQMVSMVSARCLAIDHSFKTSKRMGKVKKAAIFSAIHSTTNQDGEVRGMIMTPTKAHSQYIPSLEKIPATSVKFGHGPVEVVFTDNVRGDKRVLETALPSLLRDVVPVPPHNSLERLKLPEDWNVVPLTSTHQINLRLNVIMGQHTPDHPIEVALDMEWPVDTTLGLQGPIAMLQIAHQKNVYLIQTHPFLANGQLSLPSSLLTFLRSGSYRKIGVNLRADLKRLYNDCGFSLSDPPFLGDISLGVLAKEAGAATRANASLSDLVMSVLRRHLEKDPNIRVSPRWADAELHQDFIDYAVLDAVAVWMVYKQLSTLNCPKVITDITPGGTPITLCAPDGQAVAHGFIAVDRPSMLENVKVTPSRIVMSVTEILVPNYQLPASLLPSHKSQSLSSLGRPPFLLLCNARNVKMRTPGLGVATPALLSQDSGSLPTPNTCIEGASEMLSPTVPLLERSDSDSEPRGLEDDSDEGPDQTVDESEPDPESVAASIEMLAAFDPHVPSESSPVTRSRVLGDIFHLHDQFPIAKAHGLRRPFSRALSAALFIPNADDKAAVEAVLLKLHMTFTSKLISSPKWLLRRVRRHVPSPEILLPRITAVLKTFGPLKDAQTGVPLFNKAAWDITKNVLENIRLGYYSDPPDVQLYYEIGEDRHGLKLYRCCRGTNSVEGGVHQNLIRRFTSFNVGVRFAANNLLYYAACHNITVGTENRTGRAYVGHFDVPLKNRVARLLDLTMERFNTKRPSGRGQWVNGNDYEPAGEIFGIMPFDSATRTALNFLPFNEVAARELKLRHTYLAQRQGTRFAVLPVHTRSERDLFQLLIETSPLLKGAGQPNWTAVAAEWSNHADGKTIYYKLSEHLKAYFKTWNEFSNEKSSIVLSADATRRLRALLQSQTTQSIPTATPRPLYDQLRPPSPVPQEIQHWRIIQVLNDHRTYQSSIQYQYGDGSDIAAPVSGPGGSSERSLQLGPLISIGTSAPPPIKRQKLNPPELHPPSQPNKPDTRKTRKARTCKYCQSTECPGRWKVASCRVKPMEQSRRNDPQVRAFQAARAGL